MPVMHSTDLRYARRCHPTDLPLARASATSLQPPSNPRDLIDLLQTCGTPLTSPHDDPDHPLLSHALRRPQSSLLFHVLGRPRSSLLSRASLAELLPRS
ncbi:hypothetical protein COCNU_scaffold000135G000050 [Cocos nucifera]|nr:hypothetical protein [Cocos nucifera]